MALSVSKYCSVIVFWSIGLGDREDLLQRRGEAFGPQQLRLPLALGAQDVGLLLALGLEDGGLLLALGHVDGRLARAGRFGHDRAAHALGRHLAVHRLLDLARRDDLADLDVGHLDAPALGDLVQLGAQQLR